MTDDNGEAKETPPAQTAAPVSPPQNDDHKGRLQALEATGRELLHDIKLAIVHTETAAEKELQAAELRFQQFVHHLTLHFDKKPK